LKVLKVLNFMGGRRKDGLNMVAIFLAVVVAAGLIFLLGGDPQNGSAQRSGQLSVVGSTSALPFVAICAEEFNPLQDELSVSVTGSGTGVGIKSLASGIADIAMASREVKAEEVEIYGDRFEPFPIAIDAVCIGVSRDVYDGGVKEISRNQLSSIYNGKIESWKDLGGPDEPIEAIAREEGSGTRDLFNEVVMGRLDHETPGADSYRGSNAEVWAAIVSGEGAIGYISLNYAKGDDLVALAYEGVLPSAETVRDGSYPLARTLYLYTDGEPDGNERTFLDFVSGERGQDVAEDLGFVPLR
jgi:phosphate transport system substrate-binding protein